MVTVTDIPAPPQVRVVGVQLEVLASVTVGEQPEVRPPGPGHGTLALAAPAGSRLTLPAS